VFDYILLMFIILYNTAGMCHLKVHLTHFMQNAATSANTVDNSSCMHRVISGYSKKICVTSLKGTEGRELSSALVFSCVLTHFL